MRTATIQDVQRATPRTRLVRLAIGAGLYPSRAGQAVRAAFPGAEPVPYSIASPPSAVRQGWLALLVAAEGAFGQAIDVQDATGRTLEISAPFGAFGVPTEAGDAPLLLVAGGTGIAPIRSVLLDVLERHPGRRVSLVYSARAVDEFAFDDELGDLARRGRLRYVKAVTRASPAAWPGHLGRIDASLLGAAWDGREAWTLVCGPAEFVDAASQTLLALGADDTRIVVER